jgi:hypothetical protein
MYNLATLRQIRETPFQHLHFGHNDPIFIETELHNMNESHGEFTVYLVSYTVSW